MVQSPQSCLLRCVCSNLLINHVDILEISVTVLTVLSRVLSLCVCGNSGCTLTWTFSSIALFWSVLLQHHLPLFYCISTFEPPLWAMSHADTNTLLASNLPQERIMKQTGSYSLHYVFVRGDFIIVLAHKFKNFHPAVFVLNIYSAA